jgi:hypothetical protein
MLPRGLFERASASSSRSFALISIELLGGFFSLAPAFFFGPVARIIFSLRLAPSRSQIFSSCSLRRSASLPAACSSASDP